MRVVHQHPDVLSELAEVDQLSGPIGWQFSVSTKTRI